MLSNSEGKIKFKIGWTCSDDCYVAHRNRFTALLAYTFNPSHRKAGPRDSEVEIPADRLEKGRVCAASVNKEESTDEL